MATTIRTIVTNKNRTPYLLSTGRNRKVTIRGGETITLPYDLFSLLGRTDKNEYTLAMKRGFLDIRTEVVTPENTIVISQEGNINIQTGQDMPKQTPYAGTISSSFSQKEIDKETFNSTGSGTVIAGKSKDLAAAAGMRTESTSKPRIKDVVIKDGKTVEAASENVSSGRVNLPESNTVNVMGGGHNNLPSADAVNVFVTSGGMGEEAAPPKVSENFAQVDEWIAKKDYSMIYAWLTDNYPKEFEGTTKTAIRKCKSVDELRALLNI